MQGVMNITKEKSKTNLTNAQDGVYCLLMCSSISISEDVYISFVSLIIYYDHLSMNTIQ